MGFVKRFLFLATLFLFGCATAPQEVKRLSPVMESSKIPPQCRVVTVLKGSPAEKAGVGIGDILKSVNGQVPSDAAALTDLVSAAPQDSDFEVLKKDGTTQHLKIQLNAGRPRLGSVCDLAGWEKPGVTAAGNESVSVFAGPFALTVSGIIDKGFVFLRVRLSNNSDHPLDVGPPLFSAADGAGLPLAVLTPKEVMCELYGDKGAHLLALKKKHKETLDASGSVSGMETDEGCEGGLKGRLSTSDPQYAEANAQYVATESLWPATYPPASVADGLIYLKEPSSLPVTLKSTIDGVTLSAQLGRAVGSEKQMKHSELVRFFQAQKRGNALRLTLRKGKVFVGKFSTYDEDEERVWFNTPSGGMLNTTSYSIENIRSAEPLEQIPATPAPASSDLN
jgi:hypothetical protein